MLHQEWSDGSFFAVIHLPEQRQYLPADAVVVWEVEASSWAEAIERRLRRRGEPVPEEAVWRHWPEPYTAAATRGRPPVN